MIPTGRFFSTRIPASFADFSSVWSLCSAITTSESCSRDAEPRKSVNRGSLPSFQLLPVSGRFRWLIAIMVFPVSSTRLRSLVMSMSRVLRSPSLIASPSSPETVMEMWSRIIMSTPSPVNM